MTGVTCRPVELLRWLKSPGTHPFKPVEGLEPARLQRWSFFSNDAMVMFLSQGTIANDGFSMVSLPPDHHH